MILAVERYQGVRRYAERRAFAAMDKLLAEHVIEDVEGALLTYHRREARKTRGHAPVIDALEPAR